MLRWLDRDAFLPFLSRPKDTLLAVGLNPYPCLEIVLQIALSLPFSLGIAVFNFFFFCFDRNV